MGKGKKGGGGGKNLSGRQNVPPGTKHDSNKQTKDAGKAQDDDMAKQLQAMGVPDAEKMLQMLQDKQAAAEKQISDKLAQVQQMEKQVSHLQPSLLRHLGSALPHTTTQPHLQERARVATLT